MKVKLCSNWQNHSSFYCPQCNKIFDYVENTDFVEKENLLWYAHSSLSRVSCLLEMFGGRSLQKGLGVDKLMMVVYDLARTIENWEYKKRTPLSE